MLADDDLTFDEAGETSAQYPKSPPVPIQRPSSVEARRRALSSEAQESSFTPPDALRLHTGYGSGTSSLSSSRDDEQQASMSSDWPTMSPPETPFSPPARWRSPRATTAARQIAQDARAVRGGRDGWPEAESVGGILGEGFWAGAARKAAPAPLVRCTSVDDGSDSAGTSLSGSLPLSPLRFLSFPPPGGGGGGFSAGGSTNWRRKFVHQATQAQRKAEFMLNSKCRETREVEGVLQEAVAALDRGCRPNLVEDGLGGTYFIKDRTGHSIAVFKPRDEEALAPNNPKEHAGEAAIGPSKGMKEGIMVGEAALNEYAAFLLDTMAPPALRAGVCPTALVKMAHSVFHSKDEGRDTVFRAVKDKVGSFQLFAPHDCTAEDIGSSKFPAELVHRIAVLDIRLCNTDRHPGADPPINPSHAHCMYLIFLIPCFCMGNPGNMLIRETRGNVEAVVPIDHGYALPGEVGEFEVEWLYWPGAKQPFSAGATYISQPKHPQNA